MPVIGDLLAEPNETFHVQLSNPIGALILPPGRGTCTIIDDDTPQRSLTIDDVSVAEVDSGSINATFTVRLSAASSQPVSVQYATANGTATTPADYQARSGTLTFSPGGPLAQTINVPVVGDQRFESDETFFVNLSNPVGATLARSQGRGTIRNNDPAANLSINGTPLADHIVLSEPAGNPAFFNVFVNGQLQADGPWAALTSIRINSAAGNDTIVIARSRPGIPVTVNAGEGNDTISVTSSTSSLDTILGTVIVNGQGGTDELIVTDQGTTTGKNYVLAAGALWRADAATITYGTVERVNLVTGSGSDFISVVGTETGTEVNLGAGGGNDRIDVGSAGQCLSTPPCVLPPAGLVGWWRAEGNANDSLGNNHGTMLGGATFAPGKVGQAFRLDGVDDVVRIPEAGANLDGFAALTLDAWIRPDTVAGSQAIVSKYDSRFAGGVSYWLDIENGRLRMGVCQNCGTLASPAAGAVFSAPAETDSVILTAGTFTHVAGVWKGGSQFELYVNGTQVPGVIESIFGTAPTRLADNAVPVNIGRFESSTGSVVGPFGHFRGLIDEVGIYNRALTAGEIQRVFVLGSTPNTLDGLRGTLLVDGQGGTNVLNINDQGGSAGQSYVLTAGTLDRSGAARISYGNVQSLNLQAGGGDDYLLVSNTQAGTPVTFHGGGGANYLQGPEAATTWTLSALDAGTLTGGAVVAAPVSFTAVGTLIGGQYTDVFRFGVGAGLSGYLDGGGGTNNRLDYSAFAADVYVNLLTYEATGTAFVVNIQDVTGGAGNDILVGDDFSNVLDGGPGRDVLIAGGGGYTLLADILLGGGSEDLLIGGFTIYDVDRGALEAIRAEWTQATDYWTRVSNLYAGTGVPALNEGTVFSNYAGGGNGLLGGEELDLFFGQSALDGYDTDPLAEIFVEVF